MTEEQHTIDIELTDLETLYLYDSISIFAQQPPGAIMKDGDPLALLLKLTTSVLETQKKVPYTQAFSIHEVWMMKEVVKSSVVVGSVRVGISLTYKMAEALSELTMGYNGKSVEDLLGFETEESDGESGKSSESNPNGSSDNATPTAPTGT